MSGDHNYNEAVRKNLKRLIRQKGAVPERISLATGVAKSTISQWLNGKRLPDSIRVLGKVADYLKVDIKELFS